MLPIHKIFTIGFAENGLVLIQHSMDDEELSQTRIEPTCQTLIQTLSKRLPLVYEDYIDWCDFYEMADPEEGHGFKPSQMLPDCMKGISVSKIEKSNTEFSLAKEKGMVDGPKVEYKTNKVQGSTVYIKKKK